MVPQQKLKQQIHTCVLYYYYQVHEFKIKG